MLELTHTTGTQYTWLESSQGTKYVISGGNQDCKHLLSIQTRFEV